MDEAIRLLTIQGVSPVGILLAVLFAGGVGLWRGWWVPGKTWEAKVAECMTLTVALAAANAELKLVRDDQTELRIEIARYEEREHARTGSAPVRRRRPTT
jgi:hypothetical protein